MSYTTSPTAATQALSACKITNFHPFAKVTLLAFFDIELPYAGLIVRGCRYHLKDGVAWISLPRRLFEKHDRSKAWVDVIDFVDSKAKSRFQEQILPLVEAAAREHADA